MADKKKMTPKRPSGKAVVKTASPPPWIDEYTALIRSLDLMTITMLVHHAEIEPNLLHGAEPSYSLSVDSEAEMVGECVMSGRFSFSVKLLGYDKETVIGNISGVVEARYRVGESVYSESVLDAFAKTQIPLNVWPYVRESVHSDTLKMGLKPLVLPLYKTTG